MGSIIATHAHFHGTRMLVLHKFQKSETDEIHDWIEAQERPERGHLLLSGRFNSDTLLVEGWGRKNVT